MFLSKLELSDLGLVSYVNQDNLLRKKVSATFLHMREKMYISLWLLFTKMKENILTSVI